MHPIVRRIALIALTLLFAASSAAPGAGMCQTNLVSNTPGMAQQTDPNLLNPWGIALSTGSPFWVANQYSSTATVYKVGGNGPLLTVSVPNQGGALAPEPRLRPDGPGGHRRRGYHHRRVGLPGHPRRRQGRLHLRQPGRLDLGVGRGRKVRRSRRASRGPRSPGWRSATPAVKRSSTPPTRTAPTSTSSTASGR